MTQASGKRSNRNLAVLWSGLLVAVLALVSGATQAEPSPATAWAFDLLARVEQWHLTGPLDFLPAVAKKQPVSTAAQARIQAGYGRLPMHFEPNLGQTIENVKFVARGPSYTLFLTDGEAVLTLRKHKDSEVQLLQRGFAAVKNHRPASADQAWTIPEKPTDILRMKLVGANPHPKITGIDEFPGKVSYLRGNDPRHWRTGIPTYGKVKYAQVYPGIDLIYYGNPQQLEHDFVIAPGADPSMIDIDISGSGKASVDSEGDLLLVSQADEIRLQKPIIYQEVNGLRRDVAGGYALKGQRVGFQVGTYDASRPLVIDPVLIYSTYLGGSGQDEGDGIAVDAAGNAYVTGDTTSIDFPDAASSFIDSANDGDGTGYNDVFVAKINAAGTALVYSTYLGGSSFIEEGSGIAVDAAGNAYVIGTTGSTDFPGAASSSIQSTFGGGNRDAFVAKINAAGTALDYSTYLGGSGGDEGRGIAVDATGNAYVTGWTGSPNFPVMNPLQYNYLGNKYAVAFVAKINAAGTALVYSTYLGNPGFESIERGNGIAVDAAGDAYVTGQTSSINFPVTASAIQSSSGGRSDAFVAKINAAGTALDYSTYLGGSGDDQGRGIAVDAAGNIYVIGTTTSSADFPLSNPLQPTYGGDNNSGAEFGDAFVAKINAAGTVLVYSTYLGGSGDERGRGITVDNAGNVYVIGEADSTDFPIDGSPLQSNSGSGNGFVAKINAAGTALDYSTYLGNVGYGIAVDAAGDAYVIGTTDSYGFPLTNPLQPIYDGGDIDGYDDAFVAKIAPGSANTDNTPVGTNVIVLPVDGTSTTTPVSLTFSTVAQSGITSLTTSNTGPAIPSGFSLGTSPLYYDISTTAVFTPPVTVCISYDLAQYGNPNNLRLLHFENNAWLDVTTSHDTTNYVICGRVSTFSPFVVAQAIYNFSGFFRPVDNPPTLNLAKAGSAIPVKFSLGGNQGMNIFASGYPKSQVVSCDSTAPVDGIDETISANADGLSYDTNTGQYIYVWKTSKTWLSDCRQLVFKLNDGTSHWANFKLTR